MSITFIIFESALWIYTSDKYYLKILKISLVIFSVLVTLSSQFTATSEKENIIINTSYQEIDISGDIEYYKKQIKTQDDRINQIFRQRENDFIFTLTEDSLKTAQTEKLKYENLLKDLQSEKKSTVENINKVETIYDWYSYDLPMLFSGDVTSDFIRVLFQLFSSIIMALIAPVCLSMIRLYKPVKHRKQAVNTPKQPLTPEKPEVKEIIQEPEIIPDEPEIQLSTTAVSNIIREGKTEQLETVIQGGALQGMQNIDMALRRLLDEKMITGEEAYRKARQKTNFEQYREQDEPLNTTTSTFQ